MKAAYFIGNYTYEEEFVFKRTARSTSASTRPHDAEPGRRHDRGRHRYGKTVAPNIAAPNHQHFINFRIDFDVDGTDNRVAEENIVSTPSASGNAFVADETPLTTEQFRDASPATSRSWVIESASKVNALGEPTAYALEPGDAGSRASGPTSPRCCARPSPSIPSG